MSETINHPPHYTRSGTEPITAIEDWGLGFHLGCAVKYIARAGYKGDEIEDLKKAAWYLNREIERLEKAAKVEPVNAGPEIWIPEFKLNRQLGEKQATYPDGSNIVAWGDGTFVGYSSDDAFIEAGDGKWEFATAAEAAAAVAARGYGPAARKKPEASSQ